MSRTQYEGRYWVRITRQALGESNNGNAQAVISFNVMGKINLADPDGDLLHCPDGERSIYLVITEKTVDRVIEDLKKLGYTKSSFRFIDPNVEGHHDFTGFEFAAYCTIEEYKGKEREKWRVAGDGLQVKPIDAKEVRKLDNLFDKKLKAAFPQTQQAAPKGAPTDEELASANSESDTPF